MKRTFATALAIGLILLLNRGVYSQTATKPATSKKGAIKSIKVDRTFLTNPCPRGIEPCGGEPSSSFLVNVQIEPYKPSKKITYEFVATGGKIVGQGKTIIWDLSNTAPGSYWIVVSAKRNGKVITESRSETVNIINAICICDCPSCPVIQIYVTDRTISAGKTVSASATISGGSQDNPLTLNWTTTVGEIVSGQTTNAILIKVPPGTTSKSLDVTLTVGGMDRRCACPNSQSATIKLRPAN